MPVAFDFSHQGHALVTLYVQFLCSDWSKFDRWVHVENLCSILNLVYFDSWSWQSFVSTCDVFNCLFRLDVQNEIQLLSRVFCYSWMVFVYWIFGWEMRRLSKSEIQFRMASFSFFTFLDEGWKVSSYSGHTWLFSGAAFDFSRTVSLSNYCICLFFISNFMKSSAVYEASLCTFVLRFETTIWLSVRFSISLQNFKMPLVDTFSPQIERKNVLKNI